MFSLFFSKFSFDSSMASKMKRREKKRKLEIYSKTFSAKAHQTQKSVCCLSQTSDSRLAHIAIRLSLVALIASTAASCCVGYFVNDFLIISAWPSCGVSGDCLVSYAGTKSPITIIELNNWLISVSGVSHKLKTFSGRTRVNVVCVCKVSQNCMNQKNSFGWRSPTCFSLQPWQTSDWPRLLPFFAFRHFFLRRSSHLIFHSFRWVNAYACNS